MELLARFKVPTSGAAKGFDVDTLGNVNGLSHVGDVLQRTLDTVEDGTHDTGAQLDRKRLARSQHRIADRDGR